MTEKDGTRYCDRCGKLLTKENNKCGYEICDSCNEWLDRKVKILTYRAQIRRIIE